MKVLVSEKLSEHKYKTPEGYLICTDAILARTGKQSYTKDELFQDGDDTEVNVDRPYDEVMNAKTIASFENKPITFDHPDEDVNVGNYKDYAIGYVRDVRQGKTDKGEDVILGNLVITDQEAINAIEQGDHTDLSCGYDCDIKDDGNGNYSQTNIRGNHLALCEQGRAGIAHIVDSKIKDSKIEGVPPELLLSASEWLEDKVYIERKYHVKIYNITSNKGLTVTGSRQDLEKLYKDYHLENGYHLKIVDSKVKDEMNYSKEMKAVRNALRHIVVDNKSEMKQLIQDLIDNKPMNYSLEVRRLKRAIDELIKWSDNRQEGIDTIWAIAKENRIVDSKVEDDSWFKGYINGDLQSYNIDSLINNVKSKKQPLHTNLTGKSGNVYTIFIDGSLESNLDKGSNMWIDIVVEKPDGQQKRLLSEKFNSWNECQKIFNAFKNKVRDSKIEDAEYTYKLTKKKNDYDEYVIQAYKNGKKNEDATYYTDDWDDAINTLKLIAKQGKLTFRQQGSVFIADNKAKAFNDSKEMTMSDAIKMLNIVDAYKKAKHR